MNERGQQQGYEWQQEALWVHMVKRKVPLVEADEEGNNSRGIIKIGHTKVGTSNIREQPPSAGKSMGTNPKSTQTSLDKEEEKEIIQCKIKTF